MSIHILLVIVCSTLSISSALHRSRLTPLFHTHLSRPFARCPIHGVSFVSHLYTLLLLSILAPPNYPALSLTAFYPLYSVLNTSCKNGALTGPSSPIVDPIS